MLELVRALYGLRQSPRLWYELLRGILIKYGFQCCETEWSVFVKNPGTNTLIVLVNVDDLLFISQDNEEIDQLLTYLKGKFELVDMGQVQNYLGAKIIHHKESKQIYINQGGFIRRLLEIHKMQDCKAQFTPSEIGKFQSQEGDEVLSDIEQREYRSLVGSLQYLASFSRPDIAFSVNLLAQRMKEAKKSDVTRSKRLLRYLQGTQDLSLQFGGTGGQISLKGYCDANWGCTEDGKSTTGYLFMIGDGPITWQTRKQPTVALSSATAEYMSLSAASRECMWLRMFLTELGFKQETATKIAEDNQSCICLATSTKNHKRSKHINLMHHYVRQCIRENHIQVYYLRTEDQIADVMTKSLEKGEVLAYFIARLTLVLL